MTRSRQFTLCSFFVLTACFKASDDGQDEIAETGSTGESESTDSSSTSEGPGCGDGLLALDEDCDGANLGNTTCEILGYSGGELACTAECTFDESGCIGDTTETTTTGDEGLPDGAICTSDDECQSGNCYVVPFLGGQCGECNEDADCAATTGGGCTPPNPFEMNGSTCNMGELGGGCESSEVCMDGLICGNVLDLLGLIQINTCGECASDADCAMGTICAPIVEIMDYTGVNTCIVPNSLPQDSYCNLEGNGNAACASGLCSTIDIMGLAQLGACGQCNTDADCVMGLVCVAGVYDLDGGTLSGSTCQ